MPIELLPKYHRKCEKCGSNNTNSYIKYESTIITIVCNDCKHRDALHQVQCADTGREKVYGKKWEDIQE